MESRRAADRDVTSHGVILSRLLALASVATFLIAAPALPKERVVNYYNWSDYQDPTVLDEFTRETGIKVRYDTFDSNDTLEAKLLAGGSGYDVVVPTAYFLARQIEAGIFQPFDKSKLPNLAYTWPEIAKQLAVYDPGNKYAVNYMWGTTGIGYNVKDVKRILGPDAVIDSWDYVFNPDKLAKFKNCGIHLLDSSDDIMSVSYTHLKHIMIEETKEGLNIDIVDQEGRSMFPEGSKEPYERTREIIKKIAGPLKATPYRISITGHTSASQAPPVSYTHLDVYKRQGFC